MSLSNATYDIAAERAQESYERWLNTLYVARIAEELAAEMCDNHPSLRSRETRLASAIERAIEASLDEDLLQAGAEVEANLTLEAFRIKEDEEREGCDAYGG